MTLIITSYVVSCIVLIIVIINAIRISKLNRKLIDTLNQLLRLAQECERMACLLEKHKYAIEDHNWALDCIYELFNLQKDINLRVRNSIDLLSDSDEPRRRWAEDDMNRILHASFRTKPDEVKPTKFKKTEKEKAEKNVKNVKPGRKSTKNCVK